MEQFYFVADWGARHYLHVPNVMLSGGSIWTPKGKKFSLSRTVLPDTVERIILDSGCFSFFSRYAEYPFELQTFLDLAYHVREQSPLYRVVTLDYPCEPEINRKQHSTNEERIARTVERAIECIDADSSLSWLPVIQGYSIQEYLACIDLYREQGVESEFWAIGSICSRKGQPYKVREIICRIKEALGDVRLHAFGLSLLYLQDPQIFGALFSSDSAAWNWGAYTMAVKPEMIRRYQAKVDRILSGASHQTTLYDHSANLEDLQSDTADSESLRLEVIKE